MTSKLFDFLEGNLSAKEKDGFEKKIDEQPHLKETVNLYKGIDDFLEKDSKLGAIKERVNSIHSSYEYEANKRRRISYWVTGGSVAASVLIVAGAVGLFNPFQVTPGKLYDKNYMAWEPRNITRGDFSKDSLTNWVALYNNSQYAIAIEKFNHLNNADKNQPQVILMYACALMQQNDFETAVVILNKPTLDGFSFFKNDFEWYKALCYIKLDDNDNARISLNKIVESDKYNSKAKLILDSFEE